jgi:hypothetical protein
MKFITRADWHRLGRALLRPVNPAAIIFLGVYTTVWGFWVANPFWEVFTQADLYAVLSFVAPEVFWGCIAMTCGAITIYGAVRHHYRPLVRGAGVMFWHWLMIACFYFLGDPQNTGGITSLFFSLYAAFIFVNLRINYKDCQYKDDIPL